jgi:hypothetical protein
MRKLLFALSALAALALLAPNTGTAQDDNQIGIYMVEDPTFDDPDTLATETVYEGLPGQFTAYVVVSNPMNYNFGGDGTVQAISNLGGFEFRLEYPTGLFVTATLHPSATNFKTPPDFLCGSAVPVNAGNATVITLTIGVFAATENLWYITPISDVPAQSIPDGMAITDFDDAFRLVEAYSAAGSQALPVFAMWPDAVNRPVPSEDHTWGDVKTMFR